MPSRNSSVTARCTACGGPLPEGRPRTTCSDACRQRAFRARHQPRPTPPPLPSTGPRKPFTVYECPECGERQVGSQFCESCNTFMAKVGYGGACPHCDGAVAFDELLGS